MITLHNCGYSSPCKEVVTENGRPKIFELDSGTATVALIPAEPPGRLGLATITLIKEEEWTPKLLTAKAHSIRKNGL